MAQIVVELKIMDLSIKAGQNFEYSLFWDHFSFQKNKTKIQKSGTFKNKPENLKKFRTELRFPVPEDIKSSIMAK